MMSTRTGGEGVSSHDEKLNPVNVQLDKQFFEVLVHQHASTLRQHG
jgi:hypothetical protein